MQTTQELLAQEQQKKGELETSISQLKSDLSMKIDAKNYISVSFFEISCKTLKIQNS